MRKNGKCLIAVLVVCLLVQIAVPMSALAASNSLSLVDIVRVARVLSGYGSLTAEQNVTYDLNGDGQVNILDLTLIAEGLLASMGQDVDSQNTTLTRPVICSTCGQYPCVCHTNAVVTQPQPTICPDCGRYPCACSSLAVAPQPTVCPNCSHYPCICSASSGSVSTGSSWTCGTCHSYPCVCSSSGHHTTTSSGSHHGSTSSGSHHSSSHH